MMDAESLMNSQEMMINKSYYETHSPFKFCNQNVDI